jgi:tol-pal system protein YbgF
MLNLVPSHIPGAGLRSGLRALGTRWLGLGLLGLTLIGCATKGDIRDIRDEVRALAGLQQETFQELSGQSLAVQDTLERQSDAIFESRGDTNRRLAKIEQDILTIQELLRMNQQSLMAIRDLLESGGSVGPTPMATDRNPGRTREVGPASQAGGAADMFETALAQFNRGNNSTARRVFQDFIRSYPTDALVPDAHYYLADLLVQEERLEEAAQAFLEIPSLFPTATRVPEAYYRAGVTYIALDQLDDARVYLQRVVRSYPDSDSAALAQDRLDEIG